MINRKFIISLISILLLIMLLNVGSWLSKKRPLWNDEIYTQVYVIDSSSYLDILRMNFTEGNNCPLFYLVQKSIADIFNFKFPIKWAGDIWYFSDIKSQYLMRISSNVFMSLAIFLIFYYFSLNYSLLSGILSLIMCFSSFSILAYWIEARPYSLWFLLSACQYLLFLIIVNKQNLKKYVGYLFFINLLLSFTVVLSIGQVLIVTFLLTLTYFKEGKKELAFISSPSLICAFYYFCSPTPVKNYWLANPLKLIDMNCPIVWIYFLTVGFLISSFYFLKNGNDSSSSKVSFISMSGFVLNVVFACALLFVLKLRSDPELIERTVSERYFMFLTPVYILCSISFMNFLFSGIKSNWIRLNAAIIFIAVLVINFMHTFIEIFKLNYYF